MALLSLRDTYVVRRNSIIIRLMGLHICFLFKYRMILILCLYQPHLSVFYFIVCVNSCKTTAVCDGMLIITKIQALSLALEADGNVLKFYTCICLF